MTSEKQLENQEKIKMPWQGKVWIIVNMTWLIIAWIILVFATFYPKMNFLEQLLEIELSGLELLDSIKFLLIIVLFSGGIISIISVGFIKGWRWMVGVVFVLSMLSVLRDFMGILTIALNNGDKIDFVIDLIFLPYSIFMTYLAWACLKHPFYNQKKLK